MEVQPHVCDELSQCARVGKVAQLITYKQTVSSSTDDSKGEEKEPMVAHWLAARQCLFIFRAAP